MTDIHLLPLMSNATYALGEELPTFADGAMGVEQAVRVAGLYRQFGIAVYLFTGRRDVLHESLARGGHAFAWFVGIHGWGDRALSEAKSILDAMASDWTALGPFEAIALPSHRPELEYEEDFLYIQALLGLCAGRDVSRVLSRYGELASADADPRLAVLQALVAGEARAFHDAIGDIIKKEAERLERLNATLDVADEVLASEGQVSVEGMALVRVAVARHITIDPVHGNVPSPSSAPVDPEAWRAGLPAV